jgi:hypothetical protein
MLAQQLPHLLSKASCTAAPRGRDALGTSCIYIKWDES